MSNTCRTGPSSKQPYNRSTVDVSQNGFAKVNVKITNRSEIIRIGFGIFPRIDESYLHTFGDASIAVSYKDNNWHETHTIRLQMSENWRYEQKKCRNQPKVNHMK